MPNHNGRPLISVIMPCFNAAAYVSEAVESALGQSYGNVELLIADDGSRDGSSEILQGLARAHPGRIRILHAGGVGAFPARNMALREAAGELVAFLDADDWWATQALERLHAAMTENDADLAYCGWQNLGRDYGTDPHVPPDYAAGDMVEAFLQSCPWPIHAVLMRRGLLDAVGGFSERRKSAMDYDFWLRVLSVTRNMVRVPEVLAYYRWHGDGQISANRWRQILDALDARATFIRNNPALVSHLPAERIQALTSGQVRQQAYQAHWRRDLRTAQKLFRHLLFSGQGRVSDLRYILATIFPLPVYRWLVETIEDDRR